MKKKRLAIVTSGGGMRCSYSAGALLALIDKYKLTNPDLVVGSSGSTGTLAYFVAKQYRAIKNIWENLLSTKMFISFLRVSKIMDIDYLIDVIFKKQEPLDIKKIKKSKTKLFIAATDCETGKPKFFSNNDDIFEALRASNSAPIAYNRIVKINNKIYLDGEISSPISQNISKAIKEGATKILSINNSSQSITKYTFLKFYSFFINKNLRKTINNYLKSRKNNNLIRNPSIFYLSATKLPVTTFDNKQTHIKETFDIGYNDIMNNESLKSFLLD